jgi:hypothetical protein
MKKFYNIVELATGMTWVVSDNLEEIKRIFDTFDKEYFKLVDNWGEEVV